MKTRKILLAALIVIPAIGLLTSGVADANGKLINTGSPGENTCSQATCHGAGNGQSSSGGLADNAGPGSLSISANPAFINGNQYVPGTTYHMSITVSETGKSLFGFDFEALDNSGNTDPYTNNSVGTLTIIDATHTRKAQPAHIVNGQPVFGRWNVTHQSSGGAFANSATFNFDWKAPASGTVNMYAAGNAANGDTKENAQDNVYSKSIQLVPQGVGIVNYAERVSLDIFPNPAIDVFSVRLNCTNDEHLNIELFSLDGKLVRKLAHEQVGVGSSTLSFSTDGLAKGVYILKANTGSVQKTQRIFVD